ncbi:MAG: serine protease [Acidobacteriota bacterium]
MKGKFWSATIVVVMLSMLVPSSLGKEASKADFKEQERYTVSLELEFTRKNQKSLQRAISFLLDSGPNGFATGFLVGDGLIMTSYHVVSGELSDSKKVILGFARHDQLEVKVSVGGHQATLIRVDKDADLALLAFGGPRKQTRMPAFQTKPTNNEKLYLIARPHGDRVVSHGVLHGSYAFRGLEYLSVTIESRDGFSGSPVYNQNAEVVGIFSGYDWSQKVALLSPGTRAQKLLADYIANPKP